MFRVDSSDLESVVSSDYLFAVFGDLSDLCMRPYDCLLYVKSTSRKSSSFCMVLRLFLICSNYSLYDGLLLIIFMTSSRCCKGTARPNLSKAKCSGSGLVVALICFKSITKIKLG